MTAQEIEEIITLRSQLYSWSLQELEEVYFNNTTSYDSFLNNLNNLLQDDPCSLYATEKDIQGLIYQIIQDYRQNETLKNKNSTKLGNDIISTMNMIKAVLNNEIIANYLYTQKVERCWIDNQGLLMVPTLQLIDFQLIQVMKQKKLNNMPDRFFLLFLSSTIYLLNKYPVLYKENKEYVDQTIMYFNNIDKRFDYNTKKHAKRVVKKLNKINKK